MSKLPMKAVRNDVRNGLGRKSISKKYGISLNKAREIASLVRDTLVDFPNKSEQFNRFVSAVKCHLALKGISTKNDIELLHQDIQTYTKTGEDVKELLRAIDEEFDVHLDIKDYRYFGNIYNAVKVKQKYAGQLQSMSKNFRTFVAVLKQYVYIDGYDASMMKESVRNVLKSNQFSKFLKDLNDAFGIVLSTDLECQYSTAYLGTVYSEIKKELQNKESTKKKVPTVKVEKAEEVQTVQEEVHPSTWTAGYDFINCYYKNKMYSANKSNPNFKEALDVLLNENDVEKAVKLIDTKLAVLEYTDGDITVKGATVFYKDIRLDTSMTKRIIDHMREGKEYKHLVRFLGNLVLNPRREAVYELFDFLDCNSIEITHDGYFLAYKKVRPDYMDIYSNTISNKVGERPEMVPFEVDPNRNNTCSRGLHVCSVNYLPNFGSCKDYRVVLCKVNPAHVVAVPLDYSAQKLRTWKYEVVEDVTEKFKKY